MLKKMILTFAATFMVLVSGVSGLAAQGAEPGKGLAAEKQMTFMEPVTETMRMIRDFHDGLLFTITVAISVFVALLIAWVMIRYRAKANPNPARFSHNTFIEIIWTGVPVLILLAIAIPSFKLLYYQDVIPEADMTIKVTGNQWYWSYEYPDHNGIAYDAIMLPDSYYDPNADAETVAQRDATLADLAAFLGRDEAPEIHRLLDTDTRIVVPVNTTVKLLVTASDVLHAWTIPAFGMKMDAVPGRFNENWFRAEETGTYYGQCSELCGIRHAFMPIVVEVVTQEEFDAWVERASALYASAPVDTQVRVADASQN